MRTRIKELSGEYRAMLVDNILPFWIEHGADPVNGGLYTALDRDGALLDSDKSVWFQGRALWTYATAFRTVEARAEYRALCDSLLSFIEHHCFDPSDGRMYFRVSSEGEPVVKRIRYVFSETFAILGYAAYSRAFGKKEYAHKAYELLIQVESWLADPDILKPKFETPSRGFGLPMILLNTVSELRSALAEREAELTERIDRYIDEIERYFIRSEFEAVVEQCNLDGSLALDHFEGRQLNPGHALEGAWFLLAEAIYRNNDARLITLGTTMIDWMFKRGWDTEYGGIIYFRDILGKSQVEYWHDMKFWWPQCEAAIANLMAYTLTENKKYAEQFTQVDSYIKAHFLDPEHGEWYGYLHRDNRISTTLKGNMYKGPFHIPRMYLICLDLFKALEEQDT